jgi:hypothetical protein
MKVTTKPKFLAETCRRSALQQRGAINALQDLKKYLQYIHRQNKLPAKYAAGLDFTIGEINIMIANLNRR